MNPLTTTASITPEFSEKAAFMSIFLGQLFEMG